MSFFRCSPQTYENCYYSKLSEIYNKHMDPDIPQKEINIFKLLLGPEEIRLIENKNLYTKKHQDESIKKLINKAGDINQLKQKLKEDALKEKLKECSFKPCLMNSKQKEEKRKLNDFLLDQKKFVENKNDNTKKLEEEIRLKIEENLTSKPTICKQSIEIMNKKSKESPFDFKSPTHQRLYSYHSKINKTKEKYADMTLFKQEPQAEEKLFMPNINDRSKNMSRNECIYDRLYNQQKITQDKINKLRDLSHQNVAIKKESTVDDELLAMKFSQEFYATAKTLVLDSQNITYIQMDKLMEKLGFFIQNHNFQFPSFPQQRSLLSQLWSSINPKENTTIPISHLFLSLLAILGLPAPSQPTFFSSSLPKPLEKDISPLSISSNLDKNHGSLCFPLSSPPILTPPPPSSLNLLPSSHSPSKVPHLLPPPSFNTPITQKKIGKSLNDSKETIKKKEIQDNEMKRKYRIFFENRFYNEKLGNIKKRTESGKRRNFSACEFELENQKEIEQKSVDKKISRNDNKNEMPFLIAEVNVGNNRIEQIKIFENDKTEALVKEFASKHNLDLQSQKKLKKLLDSKIDDLIKKLEIGSQTGI